MPNEKNRKIAVLIPCYNEEKTIVKVIEDFRRELPLAVIYVFDNNSTDDSQSLAIAAGATVIKEKRQGKGFCIQSMFKKIVADYYVMVDGDDTYPAEMVHELLRPLMDEAADMVVGQRLTDYSAEAFRPLHRTGNKLVCRLINFIFHSSIKDPMSGYRAFTKEVAMEIPVIASGFDIETEMTLQLLYRHFVLKEVEIPYRERPSGSFSKLNTFSDGFRVLFKILSIAQSYKPLTFFGGMGILFLLAGLIIGSFPVREYLEFAYVYSVPKAILAIGLIILSFLLATVGIVIHILNYRLLELSRNMDKQYYYLKDKSD